MSSDTPLTVSAQIHHTQGHEVAIVAVTRVLVGSINGALNTLIALQLGAIVLKDTFEHPVRQPRERDGARQVHRDRHRAIGLTNEKHIAAAKGALSFNPATPSSATSPKQNFNSPAFVSLTAHRVPDVVLVRIAYPHRRKPRKPRQQKLRDIANGAGRKGETGRERGVVGRMGGRDQKKVEEDQMRDVVHVYKAKDATVGAGPGMAGEKTRGRR